MREEYISPLVVSTDTRFPSAMFMPVIGKSFSEKGKYDMHIVEGMTSWGKADIQRREGFDFSGFRVERVDDRDEIIIGPQLDLDSRVYLNRLFGRLQKSAQFHQKLWPVCEISEAGNFLYGNENFDLIANCDGYYELSSNNPSIENVEPHTVIRGRNLIVAFDSHIKDIFPASGSEAQVTTGLSIVIGDYTEDLFKNLHEGILNESDIRKYINPFMAIRERALV